jgi:hypothetical protein
VGDMGRRDSNKDNSDMEHTGSDRKCNMGELKEGKPTRKFTNKAKSPRKVVFSTC